MVEGELTQTDSMGNSEFLRTDEVQRMSAGIGIVHSEMNHSNQPCRLLQIWIEQEQAGIPPAYDQRSFVIHRDWTPLISTELAKDTMSIARRLQLYRAQPQPGDTISLPKLSDNHQWLQVIDGTFDLRNTDNSIQLLKRGDGIGFTASESTAHQIVCTNKDADILMFLVNYKNNHLIMLRW